MRRFHLDRHDDPSGVSGVGIVAEGVEFFDGTVVLRWRSEHPSTCVYPDIATVQLVHGHAGSTVVTWVDAPDGATPAPGGNGRSAGDPTAVAG